MRACGTQWHVAADQMALDILSDVAGKFRNAANQRPMMIAPIGAKFFAAESGFASGADNVLDMVNIPSKKLLFFWRTC
jgi:hypothetical protein